MDTRPSLSQRQIGDSEEDRPAKRRKVDGDQSSNHASTNKNPSVTASNPNSLLDARSPHLRLVKFSAMHQGIRNSHAKDEEGTSSDEELPELPARPWKKTKHANLAGEPKPTHRSRVNIPVPNIPDSLASPPSAPQFVSKRPAGFFPWTGKHPEDILSDINVKQGYFDKPPNPTEKELNTARVPLYNAFKHKSGVDNLSVLFSLVLDQKNHHSLISSVSTFKPPPRVTLTEAKRKSWIADLANADVPLRRLSRTIPQGIRGQSLLDQCLQSSVPLNRAIWFAKCVCANEIRTLKRKGTTPAVAVGTEGKWLREWTVNVEEFLGSHLKQGDHPDWKSNIQYALRLITRLYLENLLDRDHYLDWVIQSFATADVEHTPFWLMVIHIYKQDLSYYRKRGRKLAEALIDKYQLLGETLDQTTTPLRQKLHDAIRGLLLSRPISFLMPDRWLDTVDVVRRCLDETIQQERKILSELNRINGRTMGLDKNNFAAEPAPDQVIVNILDAAVAPFDITMLQEDLVSACSDVSLLIFTCLEWACTRFRTSRARIYLLSRLVRRWKREGHDVDTVILNYLSAFREGKTTADVHLLRHLTAQLSRSTSFPLSKYLQWLMVRGLPRKGTVGIRLESIFGNGGGSSRVETAVPTPLLLDVSLQNAEAHVVNLRNSVLRRAGFNPETEKAILQHCVRFIEQGLASLSFGSGAEPSKLSEPAFSLLPWSIRSKVSMWLRSRAVEAAKTMVPGAQGASALLGTKMLSERQFSFVRHVLESMEDEAVLADVVGILSCAQDDGLVASLVATIHFHAETFSAIGALDILQKRMCQIYMSWRATKPTMPLLTTALLDLCTVFPVKVPTIKLLQQDLVRGDRGRAVAACSPYSDGIAESLQQAGATFVEDFEAILQSEPNMNESTMNGLFAVLVDRIDKQQKFGDDAQTTLSFCQLLSRLRLCRRTQADLLIQKWICRITPHLDSNFGSTLLRNLIGTGCLTFAGLFEAITISKPGSPKSLAVTALLQQILTPPNSPLLDSVTYQTRTRWFEYLQREPRAALETLCETGLQDAASSLETRLLFLLVHDSTLRSSSLCVSAEKWLVAALNRLLNCGDGHMSGADLRTLLASINIYSHRYVLLRFRLTSHESSDDGLPADQHELVNVLLEGLEKMPRKPDGSNRGDAQFVPLLQTMGSDTANQVRHKVETEFLEALPKFPPNKVTSPLTAVFPSDVQQLSSIVERAFRVCTKNTTPSPGFISLLIDKLSQTLKSLGNMPSTSTALVSTGNSGSLTTMHPPSILSVTSSPITNASEVSSGVYPATMLNYLRSMLQMVCLQRPAVFSSESSGPNAKQAQSEQVQLLMRLAMIATHPAVGSASSHLGSKDEQIKAKEVIDFTFDVIATIVDEVSDEVKMMSAKLLKDKLYDVRLKYLFGCVNLMGSAQVRDMGQGLQMVKEGKGVVGEWKPRVWEVLDNGSAKENETSLGLGLFGARHG